VNQSPAPEHSSVQDPEPNFVLVQDEARFTAMYRVCEANSGTMANMFLAVFLFKKQLY